MPDFCYTVSPMVFEVRLDHKTYQNNCLTYKYNSLAYYKGMPCQIESDIKADYTGVVSTKDKGHQRSGHHVLAGSILDTLLS